MKAIRLLAIFVFLATPAFAEPTAYPANPEAYRRLEPAGAYQYNPVDDQWRAISSANPLWVQGVSGAPATNFNLDEYGGVAVGSGNPLDVSDAGVGAVADAAAANPSASGSIIAVLKGLWSDFKSFIGALTESAPGTDTASSGLNGRLQRIAQRITSLIALLPTSLGAGGGLKSEPLGPSASCASYQSETFTATTTGASKDLGATGNTKWTAWRNNSRTFRITITDPGGDSITTWPNDSIQFSVDAAATPDNTTATCPDCGASSTYLSGVACDD